MDNVHPEDRTIVRNVVSVIEALKADQILSSWNVDKVPSQHAYLLNALVKDGADCEFSKAELDTIHDVNPLRILSASVARVAGQMRVRVKISDRDEPLMLTETLVQSVRKRSRWAA